MPPSYEKDQGPVIDALRELTAFADQYGDSPYAAEARKLIGECVRKLTDHELYVARFYLDANKPYAAIGRLEGHHQGLPGVAARAGNHVALGKNLLENGEADRGAGDVREAVDAAPRGFPGGEGEAVYSVHRQALRREDQ